MLIRLTPYALTVVFFLVASLHGFLAGASVMAGFQAEGLSVSAWWLGVSWVGSGALAGLWIVMILRTRVRPAQAISTRTRPASPVTDTEAPT